MRRRARSLAALVSACALALAVWSRAGAVTRSAPEPAPSPSAWPPSASAVVAVDGTGQFQSLQAAIAAAPTDVLVPDYREQVVAWMSSHLQGGARR